ncbi:50S ribosomal protein L11 methyltransferase [Kosmotoga olearia]|uniref:Ribosomal L11 methyltransferase n=1 Tax=Kosmotoga olearia (strain ATCC BAA-1733 / DSM 21960 / TBF 19.5.1) TaxID=521045 RepID=C5CDG8_KOSOT|nr:50S ribosomal protein L11 methyltransferase [Kosmotoga olearia]ACR79052.1 ribosomal L11 methyltransferase [Kosmotoga olearia TBF 19.5.1]MDK2954393.1 ribosomal protein methyltransferase [Kosmotoga sp.]
MFERYKHFVAIVNNETREELEDLSVKNGFFNIYFENVSDGEWIAHLYLVADEEVPDFLKDFPFKYLEDESSDNWHKKFRESLKPFELCDGITVVPLEKPAPIYQNDQIGIIPGLAFGTGLHESTRLAAELLKKFLKPGDSLLDVGCGTGILSVLAAKLRAGHVVGIDNDPNAIEKTRETSKINGVSLNILESNFLQALASDEKFHIIVSNMIVELLSKFYEDAKNFLYDDGILILSGIISNKEEKFTEELKRHYLLLERKAEGEWVALAMKKK